MEGRTEFTPDTLPDALSRLLLPSETVLRQIQSDMTLSGQYETTAWLVLTDMRILAFDVYHPQGVFSAEHVSSRRVQVRRLYGSVILELERVDEDGNTVALEVIRCSNSLLDALFSFASEANRLLDVSGSDGHAEGANTEPGMSRCRECGRPLPKGQDICLKCVDKKSILQRSFSYLVRYKWLFWTSLTVTLTVTLVRLAPQYLTKILIDDVIEVGNREALLSVILAIVGVYLVSAVLGWAQIYLSHWLGNMVVVDLRTDVYRHVQRLSLKFYDKRQTGWIMSRVTNDTSFLQHFMVHQVQEIVVHILTLVFIMILLFVAHWQLALIALLPTPFVLLGTTRFAKRMHKVYHRIWRRVSDMHSVLGDTIPGIRVVKAFTREDEEVEKFAEKNRDVLEENMKALRMTSVFYPSMGFLTALGLIAVWAYGGGRVMDGEITIGTLVLFIGYMGQFYGPIQALSRSTEQLQGAVTAAERLFEVLDTDPEPAHLTGKQLPVVRGAIGFSDVSFYYEKGDPVLQNINLTIEPGEMVGLVGSSGSGKSTLVNLIARFYDVTEGTVTIDGVDIREIDLQFLRENIGMVLQEPFLFHGTIADNIAYGRPGATRQEIVQAAMMANAHGFIMEMPDGYDTRIGERGVGLSGGEKQRISIARAILKDPRILILDEATSAVDTETERAIQEAIDRLVQGRTTIAIAHRLSTLQAANRLLVMQDGKIIEIGTHEELLAKEDGAFARMVRLQAEVSQMRVV